MRNLLVQIQVILMALTFLMPSSNVFAGNSVFDEAYKQWISTKSYNSLEGSSSFESVFPNNELIQTLPDSNKYLLHKLADGSVYAVEKMIDLNWSPTTRTRNNILAGMMLWCLENGYNNVFWSYATSGSVKSTSNFLAYSKSKNDSLCKAFIDKKNWYKLTTTQNGLLLELLSNQQELTASFSIQASLIDLSGNDPNHLADYLYQMYAKGLESLPNTLFESSTTQIPFRKGLKWATKNVNSTWNTNGEFSNDVKSELVELETFVNGWLIGDLRDELFQKDAKLHISLVGKDTLKMESANPIKKNALWLRNNLMSYGEIPAIGLLSIKPLNKKLQIVRFVMIFRNEISAHEHVIRADIEFEQQNNQKWLIGDSKFLVMLTTQLGNASE